MQISEILELIMARYELLLIAHNNPLLVDIDSLG